MNTHSIVILIGCPYCPWRGSKQTRGSHVHRVHPDKPQPSDKEFPGWKD